MPKKKDQLSQEELARLEHTGQAVGDSGEELAEFFGDQIPNPKFGEPNEPKYIDNPNPPANVSGEGVVQEDDIEYKPGDRVIDPKTGEIQEVQIDGTLGPLSGIAKEPVTQPQPDVTPKADEGLEDLLPDDDKKGATAPQPEEMQALLTQLQGIQDAVPERLRRDDPLATYAEVVKSYINAEKKISDQGETIKRLNAIMTTPQGAPQTGYQTPYGYQPGPQTSPQRVSPSEEALDVEGLSDDDFSLNPKDATIKAIAGVLNKVGPQFAQDILHQIDQRDFHKFRANNPEWDELYATGELPMILRSHRHLDNVAGMPEALQKARDLRQLRLEEQRKQLLGNTDPNAIGQVSETMTEMTKTLQALQAKIEKLESGGMVEAAEKVYTQKMKAKAAATPQPNASGGGATQVKQGTPKPKSQEDKDMEFVQQMAAAEPGQHDILGNPVVDGPKAAPGASGLAALMSGAKYQELPTVG